MCAARAGAGETAVLRDTRPAASLQWLVPAGVSGYPASLVHFFQVGAAHPT